MKRNPVWDPKFLKDSDRWTPSIIVNCFMAFTSLLMVIFTAYTIHEDSLRNMAERRPVIDVTPRAITQYLDSDKKPGTVMIDFSVVNYSGYKAKNISMDVKYGDRPNRFWISQWMAASENNSGVVLGVPYNLHANSTGRPFDLESGQTSSMRGGAALDLQAEVCTKGNAGYPIFYRVMWQNDKGHVFDEVHKCLLLCTKNVIGTKDSGGRAFTCVPQGVVSQKSANILENGKI